MSSLPKHKTNATDERIVQILCDAQAAMQGKVKVGSLVRGTVQGSQGQFRGSWISLGNHVMCQWFMKYIHTVTVTPGRQCWLFVTISLHALCHSNDVASRSWFAYVTVRIMNIISVELCLYQER